MLDRTLSLKICKRIVKILGIRVKIRRGTDFYCRNGKVFIPRDIGKFISRNKANKAFDVVYEMLSEHFNDITDDFMCYFAFLHEIGHYFIFRDHLFDLNKKGENMLMNYLLISDPFKLQKSYRELPDEKYADNFAITALKTLREAELCNIN